MHDILGFCYAVISRPSYVIYCYVLFVWFTLLKLPSSICPENQMKSSPKQSFDLCDLTYFDKAKQLRVLPFGALEVDYFCPQETTRIGKLCKYLCFLCLAKRIHNCTRISFSTGSIFLVVACTVRYFNGCRDFKSLKKRLVSLASPIIYPSTGVETRCLSQSRVKQVYL